MLSDVEYFRSKMAKIDGIGDLGDTLINVVNSKSIDSTNTSDPADAVKKNDDTEKATEAAPTTLSETTERTSDT